MDLGNDRLLGLHAAHWQLSWPPPHPSVDLPSLRPSDLGADLRASHLPLRTFCEGTRDPRSHARGPAKGRLYPFQSRGRQTYFFCSHHRRRGFSGARRPNRSSWRIIRLFIRRFAPSTQRARDHAGCLRERCGNRGDFPCSPCRRFLRS